MPRPHSAMVLVHLALALIAYSLITEVPAETLTLDPADFMDPVTRQLLMGQSDILLTLTGYIRRSPIKEDNALTPGTIRLLRKRSKII